MKGLFSDQKWIGEFFIPGHYEARFPGEISYSPETGVILRYSITGHEVPPESEIVHGILDTGDKCTLVGKFDAEKSGITFRRQLTTRPGRAGFYFLLLGDHVEHGELFVDLDFCLTNMQEFFFWHGHKDLVKYSREPLLELVTSYGNITVWNSGTFDSLSGDITAHVYSPDADALNELKISFEEIAAKYPKSYFMLKKYIEYRIGLTLDVGANIHDAYKRIVDIANLFSLLILRPVYPESIQFRKRSGQDEVVWLEVFPSMALDKRTISLCKEELFHFNLPITQSSVDLAAILEGWINLETKYGTVISGIQNETGFRDEHSLHGEIVLYATQLESISHKKGINNNQKYEYVLNAFANGKVMNGLRKIFGKVGENNIGQAVGDLRNEIAHVGKPKRFLGVLSMQDLIRISQCLQIIILAKMLDDLGVKKDVIDRYQNVFAPSV